MNSNEPTVESFEQRILSVTELNAAVREVIERELTLLWVGGEISGLTRAASGHWYFTIKDATAQVRCVMFRHRNQMLDWNVANGAQVELRALPSLYEARGEFQLNVEFMRRAGLGALFERFEQLKRKLANEGLFDVARKRELPAFPRAVGVVTSPRGAAIRDVIATLRKRMPGTRVILYPTLVQGDGASAQIVKAIAQAAAHGEAQVLIVCRGGGSIEDLWPFNEESVARAIVACPIPVVSGVGHESDFTIADFVADKRAPTPTAAAALVVPDREELRRQVGNLFDRLGARWLRAQERRMQRLDSLARQLRHPGESVRQQHIHLRQLQARMMISHDRRVENLQWRIASFSQRLDAASPDIAGLQRRLAELGRRLRFAPALQFQHAQQKMQQMQAALTHLNPHAVLTRGFSIVRAQDGSIVTDAQVLQVGAEVDVTFAHGSIDASVNRVRHD